MRAASQTVFEIKRVFHGSLKLNTKYIFDSLKLEWQKKIYFGFAHSLLYFTHWKCVLASYLIHLSRKAGGGMHDICLEAEQTTTRHYINTNINHLRLGLRYGH